MSTNDSESALATSDSAVAEQTSSNSSQSLLAVNDEHIEKSVKISNQKQEINEIVDTMNDPKTDSFLIVFWIASFVVIAVIFLYGLYCSYAVSYKADDLTAKAMQQLEDIEADTTKALVTLIKLSQVPNQMSSSLLMLFTILVAVVVTVLAFTRVKEQSQGHRHAGNITKYVLGALTTKNAVLNTLQNHKENLGEQISDLEKKKQELTEKIDEASDHDEENQEKIKELQEDLQKTNVSLARVKRDLDQAKSSYEKQSEEIKDTEEALERERRKRGEIQDELTQKKVEAERLKTELSTEQRESRNLTTKLDKEAEDRKDLQRRLAQEAQEKVRANAKLEERKRGAFGTVAGWILGR